MIKSVMDYFISTNKYAKQYHECTDCGREIGSHEFCMTDGEELICYQCVNRWLSRDRYSSHEDLVEVLETLGCDPCKCPDDEETRSQSELDKLDTDWMFRDRI